MERRAEESKSESRLPIKIGAVKISRKKKPLKKHASDPLSMEGERVKEVPMKVTKDTMAGRYFVTGSSGLPSSRNDSAETEPVHTIVADRDAAGDGFFAAEHSRTERKSRQRVSNDVSPGDEDRRKHDRRQRQVDVLLDTRMIPRRQGRSINEKA